MLIEFIYIILALLAIVYGVQFFLHANDTYWPSRGVPYVNISEISPFYKRLTVQGSTPEVNKEIYDRLKGHKYGGFMEFRNPMFFVRDLDLLKQIMVKDFEHFAERRNFNVGKAEPLLNRMVSELHGKEWKDTRSIMSPTFSTGKIRRMFEFFNKSGEHMSNYIKTQSKTNDTIDFGDCISRYLLEIIAGAAFGLQVETFEEKNSMFTDMVKRLNTLSIVRLIKILTYLMAPAVGDALSLRVFDPATLDFFRSIAMSAIESRRTDLKNGGKNRRNDILQLLVEAQAGMLEDEEDDGSVGNSNGVKHGKEASAAIMDDTTMIAQCILFFSAGTGTTDALLQFAAYELALNPDIQDKLAEEVRRVKGENGSQELTYEMINQMQYLDMVISETLRKYPPAFQIDRTCTQEYTVPGTSIVLPKNSLTVIPVMSIHHDPEYYPEPERFNPEHFTQENKAKRHPYTYLPFGQGPRNCIAMRFALTEAKAAIAHIVDNFRIEPSDKTLVPMEYTSNEFVLKPKNGMHLKFKVREE